MSVKNGQIHSLYIGEITVGFCFIMLMYRFPYKQKRQKSLFLFLHLLCVSHYNIITSISSHTHKHTLLSISVAYSAKYMLCNVRMDDFILKLKYSSKAVAADAVAFFFFSQFHFLLPFLCFTNNPSFYADSVIIHRITRYFGYSNVSNRFTGSRSTLTYSQ